MGRQHPPTGGPPTSHKQFQKANRSLVFWVLDPLFQEAKSYVTEISLTLVSYGGDLLYSFALYDHIKASAKPVDIVGNLVSQTKCVRDRVYDCQPGVCAAAKKSSKVDFIFCAKVALSLKVGTEQWGKKIKDSPCQQQSPGRTPPFDKEKKFS